MTTALIIASALGLLGAFVVAGLLIAGRPVPPVVGALCPALPLAVGVAAHAWGQAGVVDLALEADPSMALTLTGAALADLSLDFVAVGAGAGAPAAVLILGSAVAGALRGPRSPWLAGAGLALALALVVVPLVLTLALFPGQLRYTSMPMILTRVVVYAGLGVGTAVALLSGDPERTGPEAGATAALALALAVAAIEGSALAWEQTMITEAVAHASAEMRSTLFAAGQGIASVQLMLALASVSIAVLLGALGAGAGAMATSRGRRLAALLGLLLLPLAVAVVPATRPVGTYVEVERLLQARTFPPASAGFQRAETEALLGHPLVGRGLVLTEEGVYLDGGPGEGPLAGTRLGDTGGGPALPEPTRQALHEHLSAGTSHVEPPLGQDWLAYEPSRQPLLVQAHRDLPSGVVLDASRIAAEAGWSAQSLVVGPGMVLAIELDPGDDPASPDYRVVIDAEGLTLLEGGCPEATGPYAYSCPEGRCEARPAWPHRALADRLTELDFASGGLPALTVLVEAEVPWQIAVDALSELSTVARHRLSIATELRLQAPPAGWRDTLRPDHEACGVALLEALGHLDAAEGHGDLSLAFTPAPGAPLALRGEATVQRADAAAVELVVRRHLNQIRTCYERNLRPGLEGELSVRFSIAADGTVSAAESVGSTLDSTAVEQCVEGRFLRMQFPPGEPAEVTYPLTLMLAD